VGGNNPALAGTTTLLDAAFSAGGGSATTSDLTWGEVGDISLVATLAGTGYLGTSLGATGSQAAGPFRPAYFETVVTPATDTFTYSGQPFTVTVTAMSATGTVTQNYQGAYAKQVTLTDANSATNNSGTLGGFNGTDTVAAGEFSAGVATVTDVAYTFTSKTSGPLDTIPLALRATDADGVSSSGHDEGTTPIRSGRLRLINAYGSELLPARVEYRAEYWDGNRWATNALDSSNPIIAGNIATGGLTVNGVTALINGMGYITFNTAAAGSYDTALNLNAAGSDASCNAAHGGTAANKPWLQGYWSAPANCGGVAAWAQDPNARIRLGSPRAPYIYLRERY
jgi:MSHA biogenesis protein MshQ